MARCTSSQLTIFLMRVIRLEIELRHQMTLKSLSQLTNLVYEVWSLSVNIGINVIEITYNLPYCGLLVLWFVKVKQFIYVLCDKS